MKYRIDYKDGSGVQFIDWTFVTGYKEMKIVISVSVESFTRCQV